MPHEIFVSYSSQDVEPVEALVKRLEGAGASVYLDKRLTPGGYFDKELQSAISECKAVLVMASQASMKSNWVICEAISARLLRKPIIPFHLEQHAVPPELEPILLPLEHIKSYALDAEESFQRLVRALGALGVRIDPGPHFDRVGPYTIERPQLHAGEFVHIFAADGACGRLAVHVLVLPHARTAEARQWFKRRLECWHKVQHPNVLTPRDSSDPMSECPSPYLITDLVPQCTNLQQVIEKRGALQWADIVKILKITAEICQTAHARNVFLVSLPLRHFLQGETMDIRLTGFEAAASGEAKDRFRYLEFLQRFCHKDCSDVAPEVLQNSHPLAETVDIFALGVLLESLKHICREEGRPMRGLDGSRRSDPVSCLAYHCLASDPNLRFQTIDQFLRFLDERCRNSPPPTVEVPEGPVTYVADGRLVQEKVPAFRIGTYPVTNFEYERFCCEGGKWAKNVLMTHSLAGKYYDRIDSSPLDRLYYLRLSGPWCPAVHVSLLDAQKYCRWLSETTDERWRLPRESEWVRAAVLSNDQTYPWGAEYPTAAHANFMRLYGGPTVVGACPFGRSASGCWDLAGNVWEWCSDFLAPDEPKHVLKGGSYDFSAEALRMDARRGAVVTCRSAHIGFRVVCEI
jgi:hypothetical protein